MLHRLTFTLGLPVKRSPTTRVKGSLVETHNKPLSNRLLIRAAWIAPICALLIHTTSRMSATIVPPVAERIDHLTSVHHLIDWNDPYYYMRDKENPKAMAYLNAENEYAEAMMSKTVDLQQQLFTEMRSRIREADSTVPYRRGEWYYYSRTLEAKQYNIYCRKKDDPDIGREEILLDLNVLAEGKPFLSLGIIEVSVDGNILAYSLDESGDEDYDLYFKDLRTGKFIESQPILGTEYALEFANDNRTVFYSKIDDTHRPYQIWRHEIGQPAEKDVLVYEEKDQRFYLGLEKSKDEKYIFIRAMATMTSEVRFIEAIQPKSKFQIFATRQQGVEYSLTHQNNAWMIITNADGAKNFKLMTVRVDEWILDEFSKWRELLPHRTEVKLDAIDCFDRHLAIWEREKGCTKLRVKNLLTNHTSSVEFPETSYTVRSSYNYEPDANVLRVSYTSLVTPKTIIDYNMLDGTRIIRKEEPVNGYDKSNYECTREFATANDGITQIPISIVYKKGTERNGQNPTVLYGYGSYGYSIDPQFHQELVSLTDRGIVYAIAHIRGGGENGRLWYEAGKLSSKKNTFEDFVASARHLISRRYTSPNLLGIWGASAGGLLMGAVTNMAPELFKAVIADVPFVDCINTMLDPTLPLVVNEYEEWGNPNKKEDFEYMYSYAPYEHVEKKRYPAILAIAGMNDPRVPFWEPAKWVAKLRYMKTDKNLILLKTEMVQGHGGATGRFDALKEEAYRYAFLIDQLGANKL